MPETQESREMHSKLKDTKPKAVRPRRRGIVLILTAIALVAVIGMVGLAVDLGILYFLKARLSQALDAAALSGARSLARGTTLSDQDASARLVAENYFNANFPNGFWGCTTSIQKPIYVSQDTTTKITTVSVTATATAPLYFLRVLGKTSAIVGTTAVAKRRDANIMIVLDRSGSMSAAMSDLVTNANWFVSQFAVGRDKVGLVTFGGTYNLIKPTLTFTSGSTNVPAAISSLNGNSGGTTNHSQPLWVAYQALADPAFANEPAALNVILFFTDGQPNTITANWQPKLVNPSNCNNGLTGGLYNPVIGFVLTYVGSTSTSGLFATTLIPPYQPGSTVAGTVANAYVSTAYDSNDPVFNAERIPLSTSSGCNFWNNHDNISSDLSGIPDFDIYGNETNLSASRYKVASLSPFSGSQLVNAAFNAGDRAAQRMRNGVLGSPTAIVPLIDTISLATTGGPMDPVYMKRLANVNDPSNTIYDSAKPTGLYVNAATTADLQGAFALIASQILHLSQ